MNNFFTIEPFQTRWQHPIEEEYPTWRNSFLTIAVVVFIVYKAEDTRDLLILSQIYIHCK